MYLTTMQVRIEQLKACRGKIDAKGDWDLGEVQVQEGILVVQGTGTSIAFKVAHSLVQSCW
jgi:hypothetical protein